ncbi:MAG: molybdate ABC transporter substrate-binding protein [Casimicrobiaceae bacterium]
MPTPMLHVLSAGAAQSLVETLRREFSDAESIEVRASFHPVGVTVDKLLAGEPCDVVVLTTVLLDELARSGHVRPDSIAPLGRVHTAIAVRAGDAAPDVTTAAALRRALLAADAIYLPDTGRSTAGAHCASMLRAIGIMDAAAPKLRAYPNGATAMAALAQSGALHPIGCTQLTEIAFTPGVVPVAPLPAEFGLATPYGIAVATRAQLPDSAARFAARLAGPASRELRRSCGFED